MKRIQSACLEQTSRFETEDDYEFYIEKLKKKGTKHLVISNEKQADNSVIAKIKMQYLNYDIGNYLS